MRSPRKRQFLLMKLLNKHEKMSASAVAKKRKQPCCGAFQSLCHLEQRKLVKREPVGKGSGPGRPQWLWSLTSLGLALLKVWLKRS